MEVNMKRSIFSISAVLIVSFLIALPAVAELTPMEELGKALYFDKSLSNPPNMACAECHGEIVGFTGPNPGINMLEAVYPGAVHKRTGNRKPPTAAYGGESPEFYYDSGEGVFVGGMFWDGRATGWVTGDPLADQAMGPFLNPVEQNLSSDEDVCLKVADSRYADLYVDAYGVAIDCATRDSDGILYSYKNFALAIAEFERSSEVSAFTSKFDYVMVGEANFTEQEAWGQELFNGKAQCHLCHPGGVGGLFTDFTYDNLGVPRNPDNPFYNMDEVFVDGEPINPDGDEWIDPGLGGFLETLPESYFAGLGINKAEAVSTNKGKHKVPTLRNVDKRPGKGYVKAFMHNGVFKSLEEVVKFYDERDTLPVEPEVAENVNAAELGALELDDDEEAALVAFLKTLTDGYNPKKGK
jgi:cytochrome c peroxidase